MFVPLAALGFQPTLAVAQPVAPKQLPSTPRPIKVRPLLSPDNYASRIDDLVRGAKKRLFLQYSYITWSDRPRDKRFTDLLLYLGELSQRADFDLRVIVGSNEASEKVRLLVQEAGWNADRVRSQGSIHNKGIVADGKHVLVSSQNWSSDGFLRNRDAGLIVSDEEIAGYFESVFLDDWESRASSPFPQNAPAILAKPGQATPSGMVRMSVHDFMNR